MKNYILTLVSVLATVFSLNSFAANPLSGSVSVTPITATINQMVTANVSISNSASTNLTLTGLSITATYNGVAGGKIPSAFSTFNIGPNAPVVQIPGNLTTVVPMQAIFFAPSTGVTGAGTGQYYIGATFSTSDGSVTSTATSGNLKVNPIALPLSQL